MNSNDVTTAYQTTMRRVLRMCAWTVPPVFVTAFAVFILLSLPGIMERAIREALQWHDHKRIAVDLLPILVEYHRTQKRLETSPNTTEEQRNSVRFSLPPYSTTRNPTPGALKKTEVEIFRLPVVHWIDQHLNITGMKTEQMELLSSTLTCGFLCERQGWFEDGAQLFHKLLAHTEFGDEIRAGIGAHYAYCLSMIDSLDKAIETFEAIRDETPHTRTATAIRSILPFLYLVRDSARAVETDSIQPYDRVKKLYALSRFQQTLNCIETLDTWLLKRGEIRFLRARCHEALGHYKEALEGYCGIVTESNAYTTWRVLANRRRYIIGRFFLYDDTMVLGAKQLAEALRDNRFITEVDSSVHIISARPVMLPEPHRTLLPAQVEAIAAKQTASATLKGLCHSRQEG